MSDFSQPGSICTLQRLNETHLAGLEERLAEAAKARPVSLILPCRGADLMQPAFAHICEELRSARWLREVILSVNGADDAMCSQAAPVLRELPQRVRMLRNDGGELQALYAVILDCGEDEIPHGKGLNVWSGVGLISSEGAAGVIATQDCDVASFRAATLARLCAACADPRLGFRFAKMYYSRVTDRLYGRVTRLFFAPLLRAVLRVAGHQPLLDFLLAFRYALAGEVAMDSALAETLELESGWGLETAALCEVFRHVEPGAVCQVDGGPGYDHRHQPMREGGGLQAMCGEIARTLLAQLATDGMIFDAPARAALVTAFRREGELALRRSEALAIINGLPFDAYSERAIVEAFTRELERTGTPRRPLPPWQALPREHAAELARFAVDLK